jgi:hypothetical protein
MNAIGHTRTKLLNQSASDGCPLISSRAAVIISAIRNDTRSAISSGAQLAASRMLACSTGSIAADRQTPFHLRDLIVQVCTSRAVPEVQPEQVAIWLGRLAGSSPRLRPWTVIKAVVQL